MATLRAVNAMSLLSKRLPAKKDRISTVVSGAARSLSATAHAAFSNGSIHLGIMRVEVARITTLGRAGSEEQPKW